MSCNSLVNVLAVLLLLSTLAIIVLVVALCREDPYDDPIGETLLLESLAHVPRRRYVDPYAIDETDDDGAIVHPGNDGLEPPFPP